jgi:GNAT superfamily N-acetyltransferase
MKHERLLANGDRLDVHIMLPGAHRGETPDHLSIYHFLTRPFDPWMVATEAAFLARFISGSADPSLADTLLVGRINNEIVGTAWHATDSTIGELGGYGFVLTGPEHRGKGIAQVLTELALDPFWKAGGLASYLGTMNPIAQHVYTKNGFRPLNGLVMRALRPGTESQDFDRAYLGRDGDGDIRDIRLGDLAAYAHLLLTTATGGWIVRDYNEAIFYKPPSVEAGGCLRPFYNTFANHETNPVNTWKVLENNQGRLVASANLSVPAAGPLSKSASLEFQGAVDYHDQATTVINAAIEEASLHKLREVRATSISQHRQDILHASGFEVETVRRTEFRLGPESASNSGYADVTIMRRDLG